MPLHACGGSGAALHVPCMCPLMLLLLRGSDFCSQRSRQEATLWWMIVCCPALCSCAVGCSVVVPPICLTARMWRQDVAP